MRVYAIRDERYKYRFDYENQLFEIDVMHVNYMNANDEHHRLKIQYSVDHFMTLCCHLRLARYHMWEWK
jgi:hypothetical protein